MAYSNVPNMIPEDYGAARGAVGGAAHGGFMGGVGGMAAFAGSGFMAQRWRGMGISSFPYMIAPIVRFSWRCSGRTCANPRAGRQGG